MCSDVPAARETLAGGLFVRTAKARAPEVLAATKNEVAEYNQTI
jgi:hypothetical protein